jgi:hypothetical protein
MNKISKIYNCEFHGLVALVATGCAVCEQKIARR